MIASLVQHTSETRESIMEYTIPQLEALSIALADNNETDEEKAEKSKERPFNDNDSMSGVDAINGLKAMGII